ncbi:MAG: histidine phosphatase family protein [Acidobacteriota bacterium]|nr:MAG: histidine phosphatase family protein [Acidobacteriota bacterium]
MKWNLKAALFVMAAVIASGYFGGGVNAQSVNKTIVLVRHSEKDTSPEADKRDPDLSAEGRQRALRLKEIAKRYKPHEIFSTDFKRTRQTAEPIASQRKKEIQLYTVAEQADLVKKIMASDTDHNLVVGHSNTIPNLANLFAGKLIFRELLESEYGVFWVLHFKKGALQRIEVIPY